jgi:hypothetical protein
MCYRIVYRRTLNFHTWLVWLKVVHNRGTSNEITGDFEEVYGAKEGNDQDLEVQDGRWDAVVTCFFLDTVYSR